MENRNIDSGYWMYLGENNAPTTPRILTRAEKGQALTHLEMDFNLASLLHTAVTSSVAGLESCSVKPTREEEMKGMFVTFSYAPINLSGSSSIQNSPVVVKVQHTTDEILYKISNETIPGTLDIAEDFHVSGNIGVDNGLKVTKDIRVGGTASIDGDLYVEGDFYVNGTLFGNLSNSSYQSDERLKEDFIPLTGCLKAVKEINGYEFNWKPEAEKQGHDIGLVAQELQIVCPQAVVEGKDGYLRICYEKVIPLLVQAVKELSWQVEELSKKVL